MRSWGATCSWVCAVKCVFLVCTAFWAVPPPYSAATVRAAGEEGGRGQQRQPGRSAPARYKVGGRQRLEELGPIAANLFPSCIVGRAALLASRVRAFRKQAEAESAVKKGRQWGQG